MRDEPIILFNIAICSQYSLLVWSLKEADFKGIVFKCENSNLHGDLVETS